MADESHYQTLGIRPMADQDAIKRAYREKIRQHHPDRYAGERSQLQREGKLTALAALDRKIAESERTTQRINHAYAVLSDPVQRSTYDRAQGHRPPTASGPRTTSSARTTRTANTSASTGPARPSSSSGGFQRQPVASKQKGGLPWAWFVGLMILVSLGAIMVNSFLDDDSRSAPVISSGPSARDLQSTEAALQTTRIARTQAIQEDTPTPQSPQDYLRSADAFMELGFYELALEGYNAAAESYREDADFNLKRGMAYAGLADGQPGDAAEFALASFRRALILQPDDTQAYRERGLLYYALWQTTEDANYADLARADLNQLDDPDDIVQAALSQLD